MFMYCSTTGCSNSRSYLHTVLLEAVAPYVQVLFYHCLWGWGPLSSGTILPLPEAMLILTSDPSPWDWGRICSGTVLPLPEARLVLALRLSSLMLRSLMLRQCSTTLKQCLFLPSDRPPWGRGPLCSGTALPLPEAMLILTFKPFSLSLRPLMFRYCSDTGWSNACSYLQTVLLEAEDPMFRDCSTTAWSNAYSTFKPFSLRLRPQMFMYCSTTSWSNFCSYLHTLLLEAEPPVFRYCSTTAWSHFCSYLQTFLLEAEPPVFRYCSTTAWSHFCSYLQTLLLEAEPPVFRYCSTTAWSHFCSYLQTLLLEAEAPHVQVLSYHCLKQCLFLSSDLSPWGLGPLSSGTVLPLPEAVLVRTLKVHKHEIILNFFFT